MDAIIIIGTGIAGYTVAREFRKLDKTTPLIMISEDHGENYPKPMLSNALTKGKEADELILSNSEVMANNLKAKIITQQFIELIDPESKKLFLQSGEQLSFSKLVLAVGGKPNKLQVAGNATEQLLSVNNLDDYRYFRHRLNKSKNIAIIGDGLIGCEFANDLANVNYKVSVIGQGTYPMQGLLPARIAEEMMINLSQLGVDWHLSSQVQRIDKTANTSYQITFDHGENIEVDLVLSAIGLHPNTALAEQAGLRVNRGIVTDQYLQTSNPDIYAIGDCAEVMEEWLPFIQPVLLGARSLARTLVGDLRAVDYPPMPITIKTPAYPLVVLPPKKKFQDAQWYFEKAISGFGYRAQYGTDIDNISGFVLSGDCISEKQKLLASLKLND